jgi:hypothetical protein
VSRTHAPPPSQVAVEAAIARVLAAEADARIAVQDARAAAEARAEAARAATRAIAQRTLSRIATVRMEFERRIAEDVAALNAEAEALAGAPTLSPAELAALERALAALAAELTGKPR